MPPVQKSWLKYFDADSVTRLCHIGFKPASLVEGHLVGNHRSPFHGFAIEFAGHRQYVPGDDVKHIDWRAYYRTTKYLIKQYEQETNFSAHLLIDISSSMDFSHEHGRKLDYAAFIAVALAQLVVNQADTVGAYFFDREVRATVPVSGSEDVVGTISSLFEQPREAKQAGSMSQMLARLAEQLGRRQVVFLISDFFTEPDEIFSGVKRLLDDKHEVVLLHVVDPLELDFQLKGRVRLPDLEGEGHLDVIGQTISESYNEIFSAYMADMRKQSLSLGIDYLVCNMERPFGFHLAEYLSKRNLR